MSTLLGLAVGVLTARALSRHIGPGHEGALVLLWLGMGVFALLCGGLLSLAGLL